MRQSYTGTLKGEIGFRPFRQLVKPALLCLLGILFFSNHTAAQGVCLLTIDDVDVQCTYQGGTSQFLVGVAFSWAGVSSGQLEIVVGNQSQVFPISSNTGSATLSGFSLPAPGSGYVVRLRVPGSNCTAIVEVDAVACTPPCDEVDDAMGGFVWQDLNYNGLLEAEPPLPNVQVSAYDCEGNLAGTSFSNADGQWSISGLEADGRYRVEFSVQHLQNMGVTFSGADSPSNVQFVDGNDCGITAGFSPQILEEDCENPDNYGNACIEDFHILSWADYADGAIPFPVPPYVQSVASDKIYWSRTTDGATANAHRVSHSTLGGQEAYYLLEMDANSAGPGKNSEAGVVFSINRPVQRLIFELLDIDIAGGAIDRVSVQGFLGGRPVAVDMERTVVGPFVNVLGNGLFEGVRQVDGSSTLGNVRIEFSESVDQVAIHLTSGGGSGVQSIGIGDIAWCEDPVPVEPQCVRIMDWMGFLHNNASPMPFAQDGAVINVSNNDPSGIATAAGFMVNNSRSPLGGIRGFWPLAMDAGSIGAYVESSFTFGIPVDDLSFAVLGLSKGPESHQDRVVVRGYLEGAEVPLSLGDLSSGASVSVLNANTYQASSSLPVNGASADGNVYLSFAGEKVDSIVVRLEAGSDGPANPSEQMIGISDFSFCICRPAPLQLGDFVWVDENGNGVQDACEQPLPNLTVNLFDGTGTLLAEAVTDSRGHYHFTKHGTDGENWLLETQVLPEHDYYLVFGNRDNLSDGGFLIFNGKAYLPTLGQNGQGLHPFMNDSNPSPNNLSDGMPGDIYDGLPYIKYTTGEAGWANQSLDAGFREAFFDLALRKEVDTSLTAPPFSAGQLVTYDITVSNRGLVDATLVRIVDDAPQGLTLENPGPYHDEDNIFKLVNLAAGDAATFSLTYRIDADFTGGELTNVAEILEAVNEYDYADVNSVPGNGVVDEDDYDTASILVASSFLFDLSLRKRILSDGPFQPGSAITFRISVINEGNLAAQNVQIRDSFPEGLLLNDANWQLDGNQAVLNTPIAEVAVGDTVSRDITFTVNPDFTGNTLVNTAEIRSASNAEDLPDHDSTPNNNDEEEDDQDEVLVPIQLVFDLALKKEVLFGSVFEPGDFVTFELEVINQGSIAATNVQIADYVPQGLILADNNWSMIAGAANLNMPIAQIAPGASATVNITFEIDANFNGVGITNAAEIKSFSNSAGLPDVDSTPNNQDADEDDYATAVIIVEQSVPIFDLSLTKRLNTDETPGPFSPGDLVVFDITVTNEGNLDAINVGILDYVPVGLNLADPDWVLSFGVAQPLQAIDRIAPGESFTLSVSFLISPAVQSGTIVNHAEIRTASNELNLPDHDSTPANGINNGEDDTDSATIQVGGQTPIFDLALEKRVNTSLTPGPFHPGSTVTFELEVINEGNVMATMVQIGDAIPQGMTLNDPNWSMFNGQIAVLNEPITNLPGGTSTTVNITLTIDAGFTGTTLNNRAEIVIAVNALGLDDVDSTPANGVTAEDDFDNSRINVGQNFDLALTKTVVTPGPYRVGDYVTYNITVINEGAITAHDVQVYDYYPWQQLSLADNDWQLVSGNILRMVDLIPSIAPGQSATVPITFRIRNQVPCGTVATNCAEIAGWSNPQQDVDSTPANGSHDEDDDDVADITITCQQTFDLALQKTVLGGTNYAPGDEVTFRIQVTNQGDVTAQQVQVYDYVPLGLILDDPAWSTNGSIASLNEPIVNLAPGATASVDINFLISPVFTGSSLTNYAEIGQATNAFGLPDVDSTPGNGSAGPNEDDYDGATIQVQQQFFDLSLSKSLKTSATPGPFVPGDEVIFQITVTNEGSILAQNVQIRDYFPSSLILSDQNWNSVGNVAERMFPINSIAPGATATVDVRFIISPSFTGTSLTNFAEISSAFNILGLDDIDSTPGNGSAGANEDDYDGATISVLQQNFDLALSKSVNNSLTPGPFSPGSDVTFRLTVTNEGDIPALTVQLRDYIPLGLVLNDPAWTQVGSMAVYNNAVTNLQPGQSASVNITLTVSPAFTGSAITNFAEIGAATNSFGLPDVDSTPGNGSAGANEDDFDSAVIAVSQVQLVFDLALSKSLNTSATPGPFSPGSTVTFRITVINEGNVNAQGIQIRDYIPLGLVLADNSWTVNGTIATLNTPIASLPAGGSTSRNITFTVHEDFTGSGITNWAEIGAASNSYGLPDVDSTPGNGSAGANEDDFDGAFINVVAPEDLDVFDLALSKSVDTDVTPGPYVPGGLVTFRITILNEGNVAAQNITIRDYIPQGLTLVDATWLLQGATAISGSPIASLAPGASASRTITFMIAPGFAGSSITNWAEINSATNLLGLADEDSTPNNGFLGFNEDDIDSAVLTVTQNPVFDLALIKVVNTTLTPGPYLPGGQVSFTVTIYNQGDYDAYSVEVTDYIPQGLILDDANWSQSGNQATRVIAGPIPAQTGTASIDINFTIDPAYTGATIVNYAEISAADDDLDPANTPPVDVDSQYDNNPNNDAGGAPNSPADDAILGDGTGVPGGTDPATDEDDHDPAMIVLNGCNGLTAGTNGFLELCLTCSSNEVVVDLFGELGGNPSPSGYWTDDNNTGVDLSDPANVDFADVADGDYMFTYSVGGASGCPVNSATVLVSISNVTLFACNNQVNVSLGTSCEVLVTPAMILEGEGDYMSSLEVQLFNGTGVYIGNTITGNEVGQLLFAEVIDPFCGFICWGTVFVSDVTPPSIICPTQGVELICEDLPAVLNNPATLDDLGHPQVFDNCVDFATVTFTDQMVMGLPDCAGERINRTFTVTDPGGHTAQCVQEIVFRNVNFDDIIPAPALPELACDSIFATDANGNPAPSVTGFPQVAGFYGTYPIDQAICNVGANYADGPQIQVCDGTIKFVREWTVLNWCGDAQNSVLTLTQLIKIGDEAPPVVVLPNVDADGDGQLDPLIYSTSPFGCTASVVAPLPTVTDNCSSWEVLTEVITDEIVPVYNQFNILIGYDTVEVIFATIAPGAPRLVVGLPVGCHLFRYKVTDDCGNFVIADAPFCVEDQIAPTAVRDDNLNVSLGGGGFARVFANSFDEGSNDNCGIESMEVRRLVERDPDDCSDVPDYYTDWANFVDFTCCDVGTVIVELRVTDFSGNENVCWSEVLIEDKINPICIAPVNTSITCTDLPPGFDPNDPQQLENLFGSASGEDDCGFVTVIEQASVANLDDCGFGTITRSFQVFDLAGNQSTNACQQVITIEEEFSYTIKFPKDELAVCGTPSPDTIEINSIGCDLLTVSVQDEIFTPQPGSSDPACYKIFRRYRVLNWCEYDGISPPVVVGRDEDCDGNPGDEDVWVVRRPAQAYIDRDNNPFNTVPAFGTKSTACDGQTNPTGYWRTTPSVGFWEYTQIIEVKDTEAPEISFTQPDQFCSINQSSCNATVQYPFTIVENCDPDDLTITVELDAFSNGTIDFEVTGLLTGTYPNYVMGGEYPIGDHQFIVTVTDGCGGNTATATLPFQVVDCAPPTFTCLSGLTFSLQTLPPDTDINGDGEIDIAGAAIWASDFSINAADCSDDTIAFSINLVGETPNINQTGLYFTCDDIGLVPIEVYFWDSAFNPEAVQPDGSIGGPNWDYCETFIVITDSDGACNVPTPAPMMAGLVSREDDNAVEAVEVSLSGQMNASMMTSINGTYEFADLPQGSGYTLTPYRNDNHRNGVSTFDLIIIQQHLLGITPLGSPYKRIAADVNKSNTITTLDMIEIQKLILGEIDEFSNNTSWRFVDKNFIFPVPNNPWFTVFPESITVNDLATDMMFNDFVAIKIGDVNNTASTTLFAPIDERSFQGEFLLRAPEQELEAGQSFELPIAMRASEAVRGYQFTLEFDQALLQVRDIAYGLAEENSLGLYALDQGMITASWYNERLVELSPEEGDVVLFTLTVEAQPFVRKGQLLSELLRISSRYTPAEAYSRDGGLLDVGLSFAGRALSGLPFRLHQNWPNPFRTGTVIGFELPQAGAAQLSIFDLNGRLIKVYEGDYAKGYNEVGVQREDLRASGLFYYRLQMGNDVATRKMILLD